jgi:hypothetical protein
MVVVCVTPRTLHLWERPTAPTEKEAGCARVLPGRFNTVGNRTTIPWFRLRAAGSGIFRCLQANHWHDFWPFTDVVELSVVCASCYQRNGFQFSSGGGRASWNRHCWSWGSRETVVTRRIVVMAFFKRVLSLPFPMFVFVNAVGPLWTTDKHFR